MPLLASTLALRFRLPPGAVGEALVAHGLTRLQHAAELLTQSGCRASHNHTTQWAPLHMRPQAPWLTATCDCSHATSTSSGRVALAAEVAAWSRHSFRHQLHAAAASRRQLTTSSTARRPPHRQSVDATVDIATIISRQKGPQGFQVIEFYPDAVAKEWRTPLEPEALGIHPRDLSLFQSSRLAPQRATITARGHVIHIKTEAVRAIISADKCVVFKSHNQRENRNIIAPMLQAISTHQQFPFELCAIEVLLHSSLNYFERRVCHLSWMLDIALHELQGHSL